MAPGMSSWLGRRRQTEAATKAGELTYKGERIPPLRRGLPKSTGSVCPVCRKIIFARLVEADGQVVMEKDCEQHGSFRDIYWSDVELYLTLPDLAWAVEHQTGIARAKTDWYPLNCLAPFSRLMAALGAESPLAFTCHPHCALATYIVVDDAQRVTPFTRFLDVDRLLAAMDGLADARSAAGFFRSLADAQGLWKLRRCFRVEAAPMGLSFENFLALIDGLRDKAVGRNRMDPLQRRYRALMVAGMHFMDNYNYDLERIRRCVVHYIAPNGQVYPFCSYNAGPTYRLRVERDFGVPVEQWREDRAVLCPGLRGHTSPGEHPDIGRAAEDN